MSFWATNMTKEIQGTPTIHPRVCGNNHHHPYEVTSSSSKISNNHLRLKPSLSKTPTRLYARIPGPHHSSSEMHPFTSTPSSSKIWSTARGMSAVTSCISCRSIPTTWVRSKHTKLISIPFLAYIISYKLHNESLRFDFPPCTISEHTQNVRKGGVTAIRRRWMPRHVKKGTNNFEQSKYIIPLESDTIKLC